jgi:hypothetical protein
LQISLRYKYFWLTLYKFNSISEFKTIQRKNLFFQKPDTFLQIFKSEIHGCVKIVHGFVKQTCKLLSFSWILSQIDESTQKIVKIIECHQNNRFFCYFTEVRLQCGVKWGKKYLWDKSDKGWIKRSQLYICHLCL